MINTTSMNTTGTFPGYRFRAIALRRVSTDKQDVARQEREIKRIAARERVEIVRWVNLHGVSGKDTLTHAQVQQILREMSDPAIDGLLTPAVDRLFRPQKPSQFVIGQPFQDFRKTLWTETDGNIELWTPEGFEKFMTCGIRAGMELEKIRQRSMSGKAQNLRDEEFIKEFGCTPLNSSSVPYGYTFVPRDRMNGRRAYMVINEAEAAIVRRVFTMALQGMGCYEIASILNAEGIKTKRAGKVDRKATDGADGSEPVTERINSGEWSSATIHQMLTEREQYTGEYWSKRGTEEEVRCVCPVIISREVWTDVQLMMPGRKKEATGPKGMVGEHLLTGLGICKFCGHRIGIKGGKYYACTHATNKPPITVLCNDLPYIPKKVLEPTVFEAVWNGVTNGDTLVNLICSDTTPDPLALAEAAAIRNQLAELKLDEEHAHKNMRNRHYDNALATAEWSEVRKAIRNAEFRLAQAMAAATPKSTPSDASIRALAARLAATRPEGYEERHAWLHACVTEFVTDGKVVEIECAIPLESFAGDPLGDVDTPGEGTGKIIHRRGEYTDGELCSPSVSPLAAPVTFRINTTLA